MKNRSFLLTASLAAACLLAAWHQPAAAYIKVAPPTLGDLCQQATHIYVLQVEKFSAEKGVILFKPVAQLKVQGVLPDGSLTKQVIRPGAKGEKFSPPDEAKVILDWAGEGKTAVLFARIEIGSKKPGEPAPDRIIDLGGNVRAHVYIDGYWYWTAYDSQSKCWVVNAALLTWPSMLTRYCGTADKLGDAVAKILSGEEVVVPAMVGDNKQDLEQRRAKVQDLRASLTILDDGSKPNGGGDKKSGDKKPEPGDKNSDSKKPESSDKKSDEKEPGDKKPDDKKPEDKKPDPGDKKPDDKKPADKKPDDKKPDDKKPDDKKADEPKPERVGTVKALAADGKSFSLLPAATDKNQEPAAIDILIAENTKIIDGNETGKLAVGQTVGVWFEKGNANVAVRIQIGKLPEKSDKKPVDKKPDGKKPLLSGTVKALAGDGKGFTLQPAPTKSDQEPATINIQIGERTIVTNGKEAGKLVVGQAVTVRLEEGAANVAAAVEIGKLLEKPEKKPAPPAPDKGGKGVPDAPDKQPEAPKKPKEPAKPVRDPAPTAAVIDAEIDRHLATIKVPASAQADDAEFLRRVTLDLTGRIPTYQQTIAFLDSQAPDKRRKLIDELLDSPAYGEHFAAVWRSRLVPSQLNVTGKGGAQPGGFSPWLAEQFNDNRGWNAIVTDLLTAEGTPATNPATAFLLAQSENNQPRPNKITGTAAALFWGVNLRCAECHDHPFTHWKQRDFWATAAFFGKVRFGGGGGGKEGPSALMESLLGGGGSTKEKGQPGAPAVRGTAIVVPTGSGKSAGQAVNARFLGGAEPALDEKEPFRPAFAQWATAADNPYFARAAVNRLWAHFFGRGFVNPLDNLDETNPPSHPELLDRLAQEFASSGFDLKHLARCIATSKTYQRTSRPSPGTAVPGSDAAFSHMAVKVLTPEVLYDALESVAKGSGDAGRGSGDAGKGSGNAGKGGGGSQGARELFVGAFRSDEEVAATEYIQGIPQLLRLMNGFSPNRGVAIVDNLVSSGVSREEAITTLYLTALSRRPTAEEVELLTGYLAKRKDNREGYRGVLWILLNSSEFACNH